MCMNSGYSIGNFNENVSDFAHKKLHRRPQIKDKQKRTQFLFKSVFGIALASGHCLKFCDKPIELING